MTREERNIKLKHLITCMKCEVSGKVCDENCSTQYEAGNMGEIMENLEAISEILEQQPCEDCISREAVNDGFKKYAGGSFAYGCVWDYIKKLPPVTPMETVEVLKKVKKEISEIELTSWDYDNHLYRLDGETIRNRAVKIIDKYLLSERTEDGNS